MFLVGAPNCDHWPHLRRHSLIVERRRPAGGMVANMFSWGAPATLDLQKLVLKEIDLHGTIA
ncbi:hypothetical protein GCM10009589_00860 [Arthrobacter pascens]